MSEPQFPPEAVIPYSARKEQLQTCKFLAIRRAGTENANYQKADGTPLMTYQETINDDREHIRHKMLEYEVSKGWVIDDRTQSSPEAQNGAIVSQVPAAPVAAPVVGFQAPVATPAQVIEAGQIVQQPPPAAPPQMTTGLKRPSAKAVSVAAPSPSPSMVPQPPPGATVMIPAPTVVPQPQIVAPVVIQAPTAPPVPVVQAQAAPLTLSGAHIDLSPVIGKIDNIGNGLSQVSEELEKHKAEFKSFVGAISEQVRETNRALAEANQTNRLLMVALHHLYLTSPMAQSMGNTGKDIVSFADYLAKYLPQNPK